MALNAPTPQDINIPGEGQLRVRFETSLGNLEGVLHEDKTPNTVANFAGLATGQTKWQHPGSREVMENTPFYDGLVFHRVIPQFMIQGGCPLGKGIGGPGYNFADEFDSSLRHDRGGLLSMANAGPGTNGSQFFITEVPTPWLDNKHSIFGEITSGAELIPKIVEAGNGRVKINHIEIYRG